MANRKKDNLNSINKEESPSLFRNIISFSAKTTAVIVAAIVPIATLSFVTLAFSYPFVGAVVTSIATTGGLSAISPAAIGYGVGMVTSAGLTLASANNVISSTITEGGMINKKIKRIYANSFGVKLEQNLSVGRQNSKGIVQDQSLENEYLSIEQPIKKKHQKLEKEVLQVEKRPKHQNLNEEVVGEAKKLAVSKNTKSRSTSTKKSRVSITRRNNSGKSNQIS